MNRIAIGALQLLPARPGNCPECDTKHEPWDAHDAERIYYQFWFEGKHGRLPTWKDAIAHCTPAHAARWEAELKAQGMWTEPGKPKEVLGRLPIITQERRAEETPVTPILMYGEGFVPSDPRHLVAEKECG